MSAPTFSQDVIALVWDFDKTLVPAYMQAPLFRAYGIDEAAFWEEVNDLPRRYAEKGVRANLDTVYLNHLLTYVQEGRLPNLSNAKLRELGAQIEFFPGLPDFFAICKQVLESPKYRAYDISLEHYVVSTGLAEMVKGSAIHPYIEPDGIWACELIERPFIPGDQSGKAHLKEKEDAPALISSIAYSLDNTTKTRALFEVNKGVNKFPEDVNVNQSIAEEKRRVPFENMIYIADGPSDVPAFSVVKRNGGKTFAVYQPDAERKSFGKARALNDENRVDAFGEADYRAGTLTHNWIVDTIEQLAQAIVDRKKSSMSEGKGGVPTHN